MNPPARSPRLMDRLHLALRSRHYSRRTEQAYCLWVRRFIYFHGVRHPDDMGEQEINAFLTHLAVDERGAPPRRHRPSRHCCSCTETCWDGRSES